MHWPATVDSLTWLPGREILDFGKTKPVAAREEQAAAFKAINGTTTPISQMALHAAALVASEPWAVQIAHEPSTRLADL
jgi:hypothetical protein